MQKEAESRGVLGPSSIVLWRSSSIWFFLALFILFGILALIEHPAQYGDGIEWLEIFWFAVLAFPSAMLLLIRMGTEEFIIGNRDSVDVIIATKGGHYETLSIKCNELRIIIKSSEESRFVALSDLNNHVIEIGRADRNGSLFYDYLLRVTPKDGLPDERGRKYLESRAKGATGKRLLYPVKPGPKT